MLKKTNFVKVVFFLFVTGLSVACGEQELGEGVGSSALPTAVNIPNTLEPTQQPTIAPLPTTQSRRLRAGELQLAADIDDIPAIFAEDDLFVDAETGSQEWVDEELVIGVVLNGDARAYPIRLLSNHEIVNDIVGGEPVMITWCPLCFTAIVFDRVVDGQELTFGVSGYLYFNNLVMYDHRTNTLWSQVAGEAIRGAHRGQQLAVRPSLMTSWGEWKMAYPAARILSAVALGSYPEGVLDPYSGYYTAGTAGVTGWANPNDLLPAKELVVGIVIGQEARAYPLAAVREQGLIQDELGGISLLLVYEPGLGSVFVYRRNTGQGALNFEMAASEGQVTDVETGTLWDVRSGRALAGPLAENDLPRLAAPLVYWFAWSDIHPKTDTYPIASVE